MLTLIPLYVKAIIVSVILAALTAGYFTWQTHERNIGREDGRATVQNLWDEQKKKDIQADLDESIRRAQESARVSAVYFDRIQIVREKAKTIIKEVPVYVDAKADADCVVNNGFWVLHETAVTGKHANPSGGSYASPTGIKLSTVGETVAGNYGICHENSTQLEELQNWIRGMVKK